MYDQRRLKRHLTKWNSVPLLCGFLVPLFLVSALAAGLTLVSSFDESNESWRAYDYNGGIAGGGNVWPPLHWESSGGVNNSGYAWADDSMWRIDTPEQPHSILALIFYRSWIKAGPVDLRDAAISVHLRGDDLDLKGSKCYFWALNGRIGTRWHFKSAPIAVSQGRWTKAAKLTLKNDEKLWHRSWSRNPARPASLDQVLREAESYGFSFLGFNGEVTGKLSIDQFTIQTK